MPEIPTVQSSKEGINIKKEQELANDNIYEMVSLLFQYQKALDKQWSKVHTKDEKYNEKLQEYVKKKEEIAKTSKNLRELLSTSLHYTDNLEGKIKQMRETNGIMRVRPGLQIKQPTQSQNQKWIWPTKSKNITSGYGWRTHPIFKDQRFHEGIDIGEANNKPVYAVSDGKVVKAQWNGGYGNYIEIDHGNGLHSFYGHLNSYNVKAGDYVKQGQEIGKSGNTGGSTGPHLHFGVHKNGKSIDPMLFYKN